MAVPPTPPAQAKASAIAISPSKAFFGGKPALFLQKIKTAWHNLTHNSAGSLNLLGQLGEVFGQHKLAYAIFIMLSLIVIVAVTVAIASSFGPGLALQIFAFMLCAGVLSVGVIAIDQARPSRSEEGKDDTYVVGDQTAGVDPAKQANVALMKYHADQYKKALRASGIAEDGLGALTGDDDVKLCDALEIPTNAGRDEWVAFINNEIKRIETLRAAKGGGKLLDPSRSGLFEYAISAIEDAAKNDLDLAEGIGAPLGNLRRVITEASNEQTP
ncbi:MAG: hypothetical protein LBI39_01225 [Puniceicoccales bacterium]|jgi:hypothetical protein|nr:hypothetical protein [Puniceicoccales bacterium]